MNTITTVFVLIAFMLGCNEFMVVGNLTLIAHTYHESLPHIAGLISLFAWTYALMTPVVTLYTNRFNKYRLLLVLIFLSGTLISSFAPNYPCFLFSRVVSASVAGILESLIQAIVYQLAPNQKKRSAMTALVYTGFSIATVLGLPLGTLIADLWNWQAAFIMVAGVTASSTVLATILVSRKLTIPASGIRDQLTLLRDKNIWLGIGFVTCAAATLYGYYTYIRPLIRQTLGFSTTMLSVILMLLGGIDVISSLLSGRFGAKNGMRRLHGVYLAILFLLALFSTAMRAPATGILVLSLLGLLIPLFSSPIQLYFLNIASSKYPAGVMLASSLSPVFYNIGIATSSLTAATTLRHFGLANLGWNSFAYALITLLLLVLIKRRTAQAGQI